MITISGLENKQEQNICSFEISVGTVFTGEIGEYEDRLFLRVWDGLVSIEYPNRTWTFNGTSKCAPDIKNYREVDINIVVRPKGEQE